MDKIDKEIKELFENNCCISFPEHLERLSEGQRMWDKCAKCQTSKTGEGYGEIPPNHDWVEDDDECKKCDVIKWFKEHS